MNSAGLGKVLIDFLGGVNIGTGASGENRKLQRLSARRTGNGLSEGGVVIGDLGCLLDLTLDTNLVVSILLNACYYVVMACAVSSIAEENKLRK